jgi:hypothetical protein
LISVSRCSSCSSVSKEHIKGPSMSVCHVFHRRYATCMRGDHYCATSGTYYCYSYCYFRASPPPPHYPQVMPPMPSPNRDFYLTPGVLPPRPFPRILASLRPGPLHFLFLELCPPGSLSRV